MKRCILLNANDTVVTLLSAAEAGDEFIVTDTAATKCGELVVKESVPFAHKVAIKEMKKGEKVVKMNIVIGLASEDIPVGTYAHVHNILSIEGRRAVK